MARSKQMTGSLRPTSISTGEHCVEPSWAGGMRRRIVDRQDSIDKVFQLLKLGAR